MSQENLRVNPGKKLTVGESGREYLCYAIQTKVVTREDSLADIVNTYAKPCLEEKDILFLSEKMVACTQDRAIPLDSIRPRPLARFLSRFVAKSKHGIGLAMPETMECAFRECGTLRILLATAVSAAGKLLGKKGWFYRVAGYRAAGIDGPCSYTLPPYNRYVVLAPRDPEETARSISRSLGGNLVLVVDLNDLGGTILGASDSAADKAGLLSLLKQNPLGQASECTPMGLLRPCF